MSHATAQRTECRNCNCRLHIKGEIIPQPSAVNYAVTSQFASVLLKPWSQPCSCVAKLFAPRGLERLFFSTPADRPLRVMPKCRIMQASGRTCSSLGSYSRPSTASLPRAGTQQNGRRLVPRASLVHFLRPPRHPKIRQYTGSRSSCNQWKSRICF